MSSPLGAVGATDSDIISLRLIITSHAVINISADDLPLSRMELAMQAAVEIKSNSTVVDFALNDIWMTDEYTPNPLRKDLVRSQYRSKGGSVSVSSRLGSDGSRQSSALPATSLGGPTSGPAAGPAQCKVTYDSSPAGTMLQVHSAPLEITWNEDCIHKLLNIFLSAPKADLLANARIMERYARSISIQSAPLVVSFH